MPKFCDENIMKILYLIDAIKKFLEKKYILRLGKEEK